MIGFIKFMWREHRKQIRIKAAHAKLKMMADDMKSMSKDEFKEKYGNPSAVWARTQWEVIKAKRGIE